MIKLKEKIDFQWFYFETTRTIGFWPCPIIEFWIIADNLEEQRHELFHEFERERRRWEDEKKTYVHQIEGHKKEKEIASIPITKGDEEMDDRMKQVKKICYVLILWVS